MPNIKASRTKEDIRHDISVVLGDMGADLSPEQEALVYCTAREILGAGGERAGKSKVASFYLDVHFWEDDLYWIVAQDYERCEPEFNYFVEDMMNIGALRSENIRKPQKSQWTARLETGALVKTRSLKDWLKVGSEAPGGIVICEVAQITLPEYRRLTDRTAEKRGWVCGTGTFEGSLGWYAEIWKQYQLPAQPGESFSLPSWSNKHIYPGGEKDSEIIRLKGLYKDDPDYFNERFGGIPSPPHGLVFKEIKYLTHVRELEIQDSPIYLCVDPGYAGAYAVEAVQIINDCICVVDEIYARELVTEDITRIVMQKNWFRLVQGGVIDIAARQHQGMPAVVEIWQAKRADGWPGLHMSSHYVEEAIGRERLHSFLQISPLDNQPKVLIDPKCKGLLSEFGLCPNPFSGLAEPYKWKEDRVGVVVGSAPEDKNNHAVKSLIYFIVDRFGYVDRQGTGLPMGTSKRVSMGKNLSNKRTGLPISTGRK